MLQIRELPEGTTAKVGDENILCTKAEVESKGALYLAYQQTNPRYRGPNAFGAVGRCLMDSVLSYFDMYNMFVVPPAHSLGRGVGLDLWSYLFNPLKYKPTAPSRRFHKPAQRRNVTARGGRAQPGR